MKGFDMIFRDACETYHWCIRVIGFGIVVTAIALTVLAVRAGY